MSQRGTRIARAVCAALSGACAFVAAPKQLVAQDTSAGALEVVIVTAQRREQAVQDVPIAIQVLDRKLINDVAAENMGDLDAFVPGLEVSSDSPTQPRYTIRGIQTGDFGVGTDPAVGVYVDGVYAARSGASLLAFNDIERIEVLKGPQGTLFGRNSAAGAVSIITRQPQEDFEAAARLRLGEHDKRYVEGLLNLPVGESVALRFNAVVNQSDGWIEDAATGKELNPEDNWAVRGAVKWTLNDATSMTFAYDHDEIDQLARPAIGIVPIPDAADRAPFPADPDAYLDPRDANVYNDVIGNEESRSLDQVTLFVDHEFGFADLRSTTAWRQFDTVNREDEDGTNRPFLYFDTANIEDNESIYQEFKLSGATERVDWIAGVSYYHESADQVSDTVTNTDGVDTVLQNLGLAPTPDGTLFGFTSDVLASLGIPASLRGLPWSEPMNNEGTFEAYALFGDAIWHVNDRLNLTFGLRYTHDSKEFSWLNGPRITPELDATLDALEAMGFFEQFPIPRQFYDFDLVFDFSAGVDGQTVEGQKVSLDDSWDDLSPRFVMDYKLTDDSMAFLSLAKGYKAGGFNSVEPLSRFDNEDVWNIEGGIKNEFADHALIVNASVYYYVYSDKQSIRLVEGDDGISHYVVDTSDEEAYGVDLETQWHPTDALTLSANLAWIDATYKDYVTPDTGEDLSGEPTGTPYLSMALGATYEWDLGSHGGLDGSVRYAYRGETRCNDSSARQGECQITPNFEVGEDQHRTDLRLGWTSPGDRWGAAAYVTNVFDDQYVSGINNITTNTFGTPFASITEPREWGVEFSARF